MLLIRHETLYRYTSPLAYSIQHLRLSPRDEPHQRVHGWEVIAPGRCHAQTDAFGNIGHILTMTEAVDEVKIVATGSVEVTPLDRGRLCESDRESDRISPLVFTVPTRLTEPGPGVAEFATRHLRSGTASRDLMALAEAICGAVTYRSGATGVASTAEEALALGQGVCQDHAHLFLACCRTRNIPARYVSGYIDPGLLEEGEHAASHAWVDVWVDEPGYAGWISIDVTHMRFQDAAYCRLAIGRDYDSAAPMRGVRRGGGEEIMSVKVHVEHA